MIELFWNPALAWVQGAFRLCAAITYIYRLTTDATIKGFAPVYIRLRLLEFWKHLNNMGIHQSFQNALSFIVLTQNMVKNGLTCYISKLCTENIINERTIRIVMRVRTFEVHSCPKLKLQPVLPFSSFVHNSSINERKNTKLRDNICYEMINWILYYCGFGNNL